MPALLDCSIRLCLPTDANVSRQSGKYLYILLRHGCPGTAAQYSPDGGMIVFMSDRDNATGSAGAANMDKGFDLFLIRPDGKGLRKLWDSAGGLAAHPHFSPDSQHIVFTSDVAGARPSKVDVFT